MRMFSIPARYRRTLEAQLQVAIREIKADIKRREKGDVPIIADFLIDPDMTGTCEVLVGLPSEIIEKLDVGCAAGDSAKLTASDVAQETTP